jgi:hypothetical protein
MQTPFHGDPVRRVVTIHKVEDRAEIKQIRAITTVAAAGWDPTALRMEQLDDPDIRPILQELETGQRPEWKDIADRSPTYKSYWAQWKSLTVRNGILVRNWESANGRSQVEQIILLRSRIRDVMTNYTADLQDVTFGLTEP